MQFLVALLEDYRDKIKPHFFNRKSLLQTFNIPPIVKNELDSAFSDFARRYGDISLPIADALWNFNSFETKILSVVILVNLNSSYHQHLVDRLVQWIEPQTDQVLVDEILIQCLSHLEIMESDAFFNLIKHWQSSTEKEIRKIGLKSISLVISNKNFSDFPKIFQLLDLVIDQPDVQIQSDLLSLIRLLIDHSQAETASYLFSKYKSTNNIDVKIFIRKCIPYLDKYFLNEFNLLEK